MTPLSEWLGEELARGSFPGASALVGNAEGILGRAAGGSAAIEPVREDLSPETLFDLASLTKPLSTGALVRRAVGTGLSLADPPGRYLPEWKRTRYDGITLENLLTHTSGLPFWYPVYAGGEGAAAYRRTLSRIEPEAAPGAAVVYSDLGPLVVGDVLETFFASTLDRCFAELVARPAGSGARFRPAAEAPCASTERGDRFERKMTADLGLSYAGFFDGVVRGEVHDGNARRRGGVAGNAGLFGNAEDVWPARSSLARPFRARRFRGRSHAGPDGSAGDHLAGAPRRGFRDPGVFRGGVRAHRLHRHFPVDRSGARRDLRPPDQSRASRGPRGELPPRAAAVSPGRAPAVIVSGLVEEIVLLEGARTPMAEYNGAFSDVSAIDLGVHAARAALSRSQTEPGEVDHVIFGNALQTSGDAIYGARHVGLKSGRAEGGSGAHGQPAVRLGLRGDRPGCAPDPPRRGPDGPRGRNGEHDRRRPTSSGALGRGFRLGQGQLEDSLMVALLDSYAGLYMAETSDRVAAKYGITREEQDEYALSSQRRAAAAWESCRLSEEVVPVEVASGKKTIRVETRRPSAARHDARGSGEAAPLLRQGRAGHGGQRLRHRGRCRGGRRDLGRPRP